MGIAGIKKRACEILGLATPGDRLARTLDIFLKALICLNAFALIMGAARMIFQAVPFL